MLLNASHEITRCGLPEHIQNRYVRYKQGNRAIVAWMTKFGPDEFKGRKTLPIKKMVALGRHLCTITNEIGMLPSDIDFYFKDVICERAYLSNYFRQHKDQCKDDEVDTINHEHFTDSLKQIHKILLTSGKPQHVRDHSVQKRGLSRSSSGFDFRPANLFQHMDSDGDSSGGDDEEFENAVSDAETSATSEGTHEDENYMTCDCIDDDEGEDFLDDEGDLANAMECAMLVQRCSSYLSLVRDCWTEAGRGSCIIAVATIFTNIIAARLARTVADYEAATDYSSTSASCQTLLERLRCRVDGHMDSHQTQSEAFQAELAAICSTLAALVPSPKIFPQAQSIGNSPELDLAKALMKCLPDADASITGSELVSMGVPGMQQFSKLKTGETTSVSVELCLNQLLLIHSHTAYTLALQQPKLIMLPRITSLKLANEALSSIKLFINDKSIFPCMCTSTLGYRVAEMKLQLEKYSKFNCWNTLMQSPYTAGNHILEVLDLCSYYGMHLFHYRQYVAAVLHVYNALVELKTIEKLEALEGILDTFKPVLFTTGNRPRTGFVATWLRYIGARLKFNKGKRSQNHKDTWCMSIPAHTAARSAGLNVDNRNQSTALQPKFDYATVDGTMKIKHAGWSYDRFITGDSISSGAAQSTAFAETKSISSNPSTQHRRKRSSKSSISNIGTSNAPFNAVFDNMTDSRLCPDSKTLKKVLSDLTVPFGASSGMSDKHLGTSKLNLLAIFNTLTRVVHTISDITHAEDAVQQKVTLITSPPPSPNNGKGQLCLCFVQTILRGADRIVEARRRNGLDGKGAVWTKVEKECISYFRESLEAELGIVETDMEVKTNSRVCNTGWLWESF